MSDVKRLVASIVVFLKEQLETGNLPASSCESLEVGIQCLESAYGIESNDTTSAPRLLELFIKHSPPPADATSEEKAQADQLKNEGNALMKSDKYTEALEKYTKAIQLDGKNAVYYCNRAAAHFKMNNNDAAVLDCRSALNIDPNYGKAHGRLGLALTVLERHQEAHASYKRALELEPDNDSYRNNLRLTEDKLNATRQSFGGPVDIGNILQSPTLMSMASQMLSDPAMQNLMTGLLGSGQTPEGGGLNALLEAGQQLAERMQQANPELVENLRRQMETRQNAPNPPDSENPQNSQNSHNSQQPPSEGN